MNGKKALPLIVIASMLLALTPSVMFASAVAVPTLSAGAGTKGTTIKVTGAAGTVPAGTTVELYWDTTTGAWNGVKGLMNSTTGKASGAYEVWFDVPEATIGNHYVWIKTAAGETNSAVFAVNSKQSLSATSGLGGDKVTATAYGLSGSNDVRYFFSTAAFGGWTTTAVAGGVFFTADGTSTDYSGTLAHYPVEPGSFAGGAYTDDGAGAITIVAGGTGTINYITGEWTLSFTVAPAAGAKVLTYNYFATGGNLYLLNQGTTSSVGTFSASVTIPSAAGAGAYIVAALDGDGNEIDKAFTIGPVITLNPTAGVVGQVISVTGRGFTAADTIGAAAVDVQLYEGATLINNVVIKDMPAGGVVVDGSGRFTMNIIIPSGNGINDDYTIQVTSDVAADVATADFEITAQSPITVSPKYAPQGSSIVVSGTGFDKISGETVTIDLYTTLGVFVVNIGDTETTSTGTFSTSLNVPAQVDGTYRILAWSASNIMNDTSFRIGTMYAQLSSTSGPAGKGVTITGNGFTAGGAWNATIGGEDFVTTAQAGTASGAGLINFLAYIPSMAPGTYTVSVYDIAADITLSTTFTVTYDTQITLGTSTAPNGFNLTINGKGFSQTAPAVNFVLYNKTSTGAYDRSWAMNVFTNYAGIAVAAVNASGKIRAYYVIPGSATLSKGTYYINATDASANAYFAQATLIIGDVHEVCTPRKTGFAVGETVSFTVQHSFGGVVGSDADGSYIKIWDPSGTLIFAGDPFWAAEWISTGNYWTLPYSDQTAGGNPMTLRDDAATGTWSWTWYDVNDDAITSGTFAVTASATSQTDAKIAELSTQLTSLASTVSQLATTVNSVATTASSASTAATAATTAANAAKTSADAATTAATAAGTKADAATTAANSAKTSADNAAAAANGLTTLVYAAIGASLVAALAAIVALMQISRKIA